MGSPHTSEEQDGAQLGPTTSNPHPPTKPDPAADPGVVPSIRSPPPDDGATPAELDIFTLTPIAALKMLCRSIDGLVRFTGEVPPTPPARSPRASSLSLAYSSSASSAPPPKDGLHLVVSREEIDGVPFRKTPIGSPEAHHSEPTAHDVGAGAEPIYLQQGAIARKFYSKRPPPISTEDYLLRMHKYCPMSTAVYLATLAYINRMAAKDKIIPVTPRNVHRLLLAGLRVAMKALEDLSWPHARFSKVGGVSEMELGRLEITFCFLMNFDLKVDAEMLQKEVERLEQADDTAIQDSPVSQFELMMPEKKRKASSVLPERPKVVDGGVPGIEVGAT